ncbi:MAG TPA: hypothetical protein VNO55_19815 [Polyangia bacterium]|nr:hypothetical protein [Polyangia bacterium]
MTKQDHIARLAHGLHQRAAEGCRMTAPEFRAALDQLGWSQRGLAFSLGVSHNTVHRWALDQARVPAYVAGWLEEMIAHMADAPPPPAF